MGPLLVMWWIARLQAGVVVGPEEIERRLHHWVHLYKGQHRKTVIKLARGLPNGKEVRRVTK